jgi:hypothetical protein
MKLTSTNRPFGLIIKLSQSVFEEEQKKQRLFCTVKFDHESSLYASQMSVVLRPPIISVVALAALFAVRERKEIEFCGWS